jgi:hypothetical protein
MLTSLFVVSIIVTFSITSLQLMIEPVIVCEAPQSITATDFPLMTLVDWSDGLAIAAFSVLSLNRYAYRSDILTTGTC